MLKYDGERCIPEFMANKVKILSAHYTRYNFALMYTRNKRVLDAACGVGFGANMMSDVAKSVTGLDNNAAAVEYANEKYNGVFLRKDLNSEFIDINFDIVVSFETIEHLSNYKEFFKNVKEHSKEFLFSIPVNDKNDFHVNVWSAEEIKALMEAEFGHVDWFSQKGLNINRGFSERAKYLIGYVKIKE